MKLLRDPLFIFLAGGLLIFALDGWFAGRPGPDQVIHITQAHVDRLRSQWLAQMQRTPTDAELNGLVESLIKEEVYYREARQLGLDVEDTIIRRRLVQKLTFITEDSQVAQSLSQEDVQAYFEATPEAYRRPIRTSFRHRFFSSDRRDNAEADAAQSLEDESNKGDPFMLQRSFALRSDREIGDLFGREFSVVLAELPVSEDWQGPVQSAYGWHAVQLMQRAPSELPKLEQIYDRVMADARQAARKEANEAYYAALRTKYTIQMPEDGADESGLAE